MNYQLCSSPFRKDCEPITINHPLGDLPLLDSTLDVKRTAFLCQYGLSLNEAPACPKFSFFDGFWVFGKGLQKILDKDCACVFVDEEGHFVACKFVTPESPEFERTERQILPAEDIQRLRYPWDYLTLHETLGKRFTPSSPFESNDMVSKAACIDGQLIIGEGTRVLPGVYIEGTLITGKGCKIGPNCYIRGTVSLGDNCHIGQAVELKNTVVMSHTNIAHLSYIGDSVVGEYVNLGAGTIVANLRHDGNNQHSTVDDKLVDTGRRKLGTVIGDGVHTGIHTSIYPGRKMWPHTSTRPGEVVQKDIQG